MKRTLSLFLAVALAAALLVCPAAASDSAPWVDVSGGTVTVRGLSESWNGIQLTLKLNKAASDDVFEFDSALPSGHYSAETKAENTLTIYITSRSALNQQGENTLCLGTLKADEGFTIEGVSNLRLAKVGPNMEDTYSVTYETVSTTDPGGSGNGGGGNGGGSVGGGGSSGGSGGKTETVKLDDGTVITTTKNRDGSTKVKTVKPDGTTIVEEKKADGSSKATTKTKDGSTSTANTSADGKTTAEVTLSAKANTGDTPVTLPMPKLEVTSDAANAPVVTVKTANKKPAKIEIPVSNMVNGVVAILVKPNGTEQIVNASVPTNNGIMLTVESGAVVKLVNNSKKFTDTEGHWGNDYIDFVSSHQLIVGTSETQFSPNVPMTRAMTLTVLARFDYVDTTEEEGSVWYAKAVAWAKENGLSEGTEPNASIPREELVTLMYRYAKMKGLDTTAEADLSSFKDANLVSDSAVDAMKWAVQTGLVLGNDDGTINPKGGATRAEVSAIMVRYAEKFVV